jgi:peroxiredoxin
MKLHTPYAPPTHRDGVVHHTRDDAETDSEHFEVVMGTEATMKEYGGVESLPTSFLIDRQGRVAGVHAGLVERAEYIQDIEALLGK